MSSPHFDRPFEPSLKAPTQADPDPRHATVPDRRTMDAGLGDGPAHVNPGGAPAVDSQNGDCTMPFVRIARRATPVSILVALVASLALSLAASTPSFAQDTSPVRQGEIAGVKEEMLAWIQEGEGKLIELARTVPEAKYSWTPGKGVRTFGEVFLHVAAANFGVPGFVGTPPPAGFKFEGYEHSLTKKN